MDGKVVATRKLPMIQPWEESCDIGSDTLTGVNDPDYRPPFPLSGRLNRLTVKLDRPPLSAQDIRQLEAAQRNTKISE